MGHDELLERWSEVGQADELLRRARDGDGSLLVIDGPAGIGKTRLLTEVSRIARDRGFSVGRARGSELEREHAFGLVRQLLATPERTNPGGAAGDAAALANRVFALRRAIPFEPMPAHRVFATLYGLYWMCAQSAARSPLLLAIDDAHWGDAGSLDFISYLVRRLEGIRSLVVLTRRDPGRGAPGDAIDTLLSEGLAVRLRLAPLSERGTRQLVESILGKSASEEFATACHWATRGNPLLARELAVELAHEGVEPTAEQTVAVRQIGAPNVSSMTNVRLARLGSGAFALAHAVAVLGRDAGLATAAELAGLDFAVAADIADALVDAGILAGTHPMTFMHPLVQNAVYRDLPSAKRAMLHRRAASILADAGLSGEVVCVHLLKSEPHGDPWVIEQLRSGAADALERGAPASATSYLERALAEPPVAAQRAALLFTLGHTEALAGHPGCVQRLQLAIELADDVLLRGRAALALAQIRCFQGEIVDTVRLLARAVEDFDSACASELALIAEAELANNALLDTRTAPSARAAGRRLADRVRGHSSGARHGYSALACLAAIETQPRERVAALAGRALTSPVSGRDALDSPVRYVAAFALMFGDHFEESAAALKAEIADSQARGSLHGVLVARIIRSHLQYRLGAVAEAEGDAAEVFSAGVALPAVVQSMATAFYADALLARGRLDEAGSIVESFPIAAESSGALVHVLHTRAQIRAARGELAAALGDLRDCGRRMRAIGSENPGTIPWRSGLARLLVESGEREEASELARAEVELARRSGAPRALGIALLAQGHCGRGRETIGSIREAISVLRPSPARLEYARALVGLGIELSRDNRRADARGPLREGLDLARRCGATSLAKEAHTQLLVVGARPRRERLTGVGALTSSELRIARLAAEGRSNPQIAQALFVTRKTVETHLSNAYAKLDVAGRAGLASALAIAETQSDLHPR